MNTIKNISGFSAALLMTVSMGTVYAVESDASSVNTQDRVRTELNMQAASADFGQSKNREEHTVTNQNQNKYQYQYRNKYQNGGADSMKSTNEANNIWHGYENDSNLDRMNATNRYMQGGSAAGSMNRQNTANRSMSSSRR